MNPSFRLILNGIPYSAEELRSAARPARHTEFERATLAFCKDWLTGQQEFNIETSGSTGPRKEIVLHRRQMEASARLTEKAIGLAEGYQALLCLDTRYIAGKMMLVRSMVTGMVVIAVEPQANPLAKISERIDFAALVPYQLHSILLDPASKEKLGALKCALVGGAAVDASTAKLLADLPCACYASYGMTETISHVALQRLNGPGAQHQFHALDGVSFRQDERGCLLIKAQHLGDNEYVTNDLVELTDAHRFRWLGRYDNVINSGGVKVIPEKIERTTEQIFSALNIGNRFFVSAQPHETLGELVILIVEGELTHGLQSEILSRLGHQLLRYEVPKAIKFIPAFAQTDNGKLDRIKTLRLVPA